MNTKRLISLTASIAVAAACLLMAPTTTVSADQHEPARILLITGNDHPNHDWKAVSNLLKEVLEADGKASVEITENPEDLASKDLTQYDAILLNYLNWMAPGLSESAKANFVKYIEDGGGLIVHHASCGAFHPSLPKAEDSDWPKYRKIVRRVWVFGRTRPISFHDPYGPARVELTSVKHPITEGLTGFDTKDEIYFNLAGDEPIEPLAVAYSKLTKRIEPMAFVHHYGKGRVFQTTLGHAVESVQASAALTVRGTLWAAGKIR